MNREEFAKHPLVNGMSADYADALYNRLVELRQSQYSKEREENLIKEAADDYKHCMETPLYTKRYNAKGKPHFIGGPAFIFRLNDKVIREEWWVNGERHRGGDEPAVVTQDGNYEWWVNGERHRGDDKPAVITKDGRQEWWLYGERHRGGDKPAVSDEFLMEWYYEGCLHRGDDKPAVWLHKNGDREWWVRGKRHRYDGPAVVCQGYKQWWVDDKLHRQDGPAVVFSDGRELWWINGEPVQAD